MVNPDAGKPSFHPAFGVNSIKNHVAIVLEMDDSVQYSLWAELFLTTATAYEVADHLVDPPVGTSSTATVDRALWSRLDAIVKQWIYATISNDLLQTVVEAGCTAKVVWERIRDLFNDNKNSRAVFLEQQFTATKHDDFPSVSAYCQALKVIADQLNNVGSKVSNDRLVLQMVTNLSDGYDNIAAIIQQQDPLPPFYKARSMLALEESRKNKSVSSSSGTALAAIHSDDNEPTPSATASNNNNRGFSGRGRGNNRKNNYRGHNRNNGGGGSRGSSSKDSGHTASGQQQTRSAAPASSLGHWAWIPHGSTAQPAAWSPPPCPYPTMGWVPPSYSGAGILGPRPQQAFVAQPSPGPAQQPLASPSVYYPTELAAAMQSMSLQPPDESWYMDTGASSHMTSDPGPSDGDTTYEMQ